MRGWVGFETLRVDSERQLVQGRSAACSNYGTPTSYVRLHIEGLRPWELVRLPAESDEPFVEPVRHTASAVVVETARQKFVAGPQFAVALRLHTVGASAETAVVAGAVGKSFGEV